MKSAISLSLLATLLFSSCAPQYARMTQYQLAEPYGVAKDSLMKFQRSEARTFNLFQDEVRFENFESRPGAELRFMQIRWAPDLGTTPKLSAVLTATPGGSKLVAKELKNPGAFYDGARAISKDPLGNLAPLDEWVRTYLRVKQRSVGEDTSSPPLYRGY